MTEIRQDTAAEKRVDLHLPTRYLVADAPDAPETLIADIVLQLLRCVAQTEREFPRLWQTDSINAAKARGAKRGRTPTEYPPELAELRNVWRRSICSAAPHLAGLLRPAL